jgi:hypothetical protein
MKSKIPQNLTTIPPHRPKRRRRRRRRQALFCKLPKNSTIQRFNNNKQLAPQNKKPTRNKHNKHKKNTKYRRRRRRKRTKTPHALRSPRVRARWCDMSDDAKKTPHQISITIIFHKTDFKEKNRKI